METADITSAASSTQSSSYIPHYIQDHKIGPIGETSVGVPNCGAETPQFDQPSVQQHIISLEEEKIQDNSESKRKNKESLKLRLSSAKHTPQTKTIHLCDKININLFENESDAFTSEKGMTSPTARTNVVNMPDCDQQQHLEQRCQVTPTHGFHTTPGAKSSRKRSAASKTNLEESFTMLYSTELQS